MSDIKIKRITLREWFYIAGAHSHNIRKGYDQFTPQEIHKLIDCKFIYNEALFDQYRPTVPDIDNIKKIPLSELAQDQYPFIDFDNSIAYLPKFFWLNFKRTFQIDGYIGHHFSEENYEIENYNAFNNPICKIEKFIVATEMRKEQLPLFDLVTDKMNTNRHNDIRGIIKANPGFGKSISAMKITSNTKLRTLIIVPNDVLLKQWKKAILEFSNFKEEDIGNMQGSDVNQLLIEGQKEICLVIINSLYSQIKRLGHEYCYGLYENFGLVFIDECHVAGAAESFSKSTNVFKTNNILGLTATPYRKGINDFLLENSIGPVFWESSHQNLIPHIHIHNNYIEFDPKVLNKLQFFRHDYIRFLTVYNAALYESNAYFNYLADWVNYRSVQGYKTILIFATNKMVYKLNKMLQIKYKIDAGIIVGVTEKEVKKEKDKLTQLIIDGIIETYFLVYPKKKVLPKLEVDSNITAAILKLIDESNAFRRNHNMDEIGIIEQEVVSSEMEVAKKKQVIIGNVQCLSAGFDDTMCSCLFICTPLVGKVVTIQSVGRITRINPNKIQEVHAHFMFSTIFTSLYPDMHWTLIRNLKTGFPDARFHLEGYPS